MLLHVCCTDADVLCRAGRASIYLAVGRHSDASHVLQNDDDGDSLTTQAQISIPTMIDLALALLPIAAIGYSLIYLLFGGGLVGAVVIFFIAKMFRK